MLLLLFAVGCQPKDLKESTPEDSGFVFRDTSAVVDTAPDDTDTTDSVGDTHGETATHDSDTDTGPIDTGGPTPWLELLAWPSAIVVNPGATFTLRVVGTDPDGTRGDLPDDRGTPTFTSDDAAVATVDAAGVVTAVAAGSTTVRVALGGLEADCAVEVRDDGLATVTVLDGSTGLPIADAKVALPFTTPIHTDASGVALVPVSDAGPLTFSAWVDDTYDALTVTGVVGRAITVSILPKDTDPRSASIEGTIDFSGVDDAGWSDLVVGFAATSIQGALAPTRLEDLFSDERTVSVFGVDAEAPANLFVEGAAETYASTALPGMASVWAMAGPIAVSDATSGLSGTGDALALLATNIDSMSWGWTSALTTTADTVTTADIAPAERFVDTTDVSVPPLPAGFVGDETYLLLVTEERVDEGYVVTGLGTGSPASPESVPTVTAGTVTDSLGTSVLAYTQVGGVGSGGPVSAGVATPDAEGNLIVPLLQDVATVDSWDPAAHTLAVTVDADADFVRIRLRDSRNRVHDILAPGGWSGTIPNCVTSFGFAQATLEVLALQTTDGAWESWVSGDDLDPETKLATTAARTTED